MKKKMKVNKLKTLINKQVVTVKETIKTEDRREEITQNSTQRGERCRRSSKLKNSMSLSGQWQ